MGKGFLAADRGGRKADKIKGKGWGKGQGQGQGQRLFLPQTGADVGRTGARA